MKGIHVCNGGPSSVKWCGKTATVVCTERVDSAPSEVAALLGPGRLRLKWFACDDVEHREGAELEPIEAWLERVAMDVRRNWTRGKA